MNVTYDDGVFEELVNLSAFLAEDNEEAAQTFLNSCDHTFRFLADHPRAGSPGKFEDPRLATVRMWRVKGFEAYLIFYVPAKGGIKILHILHSATDYKRAFDG